MNLSVDTLMKFNTKKITKYFAYTFVLVISFLGAGLLPVGEFTSGIIAIPGVLALIVVLYQITRDEWKHEKDIILQNKLQDFILSTSSHIADVSYDKHVLFCEEYIERVQQGRKELLRDGGSPETMKIGGDLVRIRQKHSAWLTDDIENKLKPFEHALIKIGANEEYLRMTAGDGMNDKKREIIDGLYKSLGLMLGHEKPSNNEESDIRIDKIIDRIRDILGIKIMTELRSRATDVALKRLNEI